MSASPQGGDLSEPPLRAAVGHAPAAPPPGRIRAALGRAGRCGPDACRPGLRRRRGLVGPPYGLEAAQVFRIERPGLRRTTGAPSTTSPSPRASSATPTLMPRAKARGWCKPHGIPECTLVQPDPGPTASAADHHRRPTSTAQRRRWTSPPGPRTTRSAGRTSGGSSSPPPATRTRPGSRSSRCGRPRPWSSSPPPARSATTRRRWPTSRPARPAPSGRSSGTSATA